MMMGQSKFGKILKLREQLEEGVPTRVTKVMKPHVRTARSSSLQNIFRKMLHLPLFSSSHDSKQEQHHQEEQLIVSHFHFRMLSGISRFSQLLYFPRRPCLFFTRFNLLLISSSPQFYFRIIFLEFPSGGILKSELKTTASCIITQSSTFPIHAPLSNQPIGVSIQPNMLRNYCTVVVYTTRGGDANVSRDGDNFGAGDDYGVNL